MTNLEAALAYASSGHPVFPLKVRSKQPDTAHGFKDATCDPATITGWWTRSPEANIGMPNGAPSGLWVLDIDPRNDAEGAWTRLVDEHGEPHTRTVRTAGGGLHFYFTYPASGVKRRKSRYAGIEFCGDGGYTVAPPSVTDAGHYEVIDPCPPQLAPPWVMELAEAPLTLKAPVPLKIPEGQRDNTLYRIACHYRAAGESEAAILTHIERENRTRCSPPLELSDLARIARSAARYPAGKPIEESALANGSGQRALEPYKFLDLWEMQANGIPPLDWLIPGWLVHKDICIIGGDAYSGKSTTAAQLARCLASGEPWLGIAPTRRVPVFYFDEEQGSEMVARLFLRLGGPVDGLQVASGQGINLSSHESIEKLVATVRNGTPPVVILDTVQQTFGVDDANSATKVGSIYSNLFRIRDAISATFILLHHISKPKESDTSRLALHRLRDSSVHATQASTVWFMEPVDRACADLRQAKRRGGERTSLRVNYSTDESEAIRLSANEIGPAENATDQLAREIADYVHREPIVRTAELNAIGERAGVSKSLVKKVVDRLVSEHSIVNVKRGFYAAPTGTIFGSNETR